MSETPKLKDQLLGLVETAVNTVKVGAVMLPDDQAMDRYIICMECPFLTIESKNLFGKIDGKTRCKKCGCDMEKKVRFAGAKCADKENPRW